MSQLGGSGRKEKTESSWSGIETPTWHLPLANDARSTITEEIGKRKVGGGGGRIIFIIYEGTSSITVYRLIPKDLTKLFTADVLHI